MASCGSARGRGVCAGWNRVTSTFEITESVRVGPRRHGPGRFNERSRGAGFKLFGSTIWAAGSASLAYPPKTAGSPEVKSTGVVFDLGLDAPWNSAIVPVPIVGPGSGTGLGNDRGRS